MVKKNLVMKGGALREPKENKLRYDLIPIDGLKRLALHYSTGAIAHGDRNRENGDMTYAEGCKQSARRHFIQRQNNETDEDHASACIRNIFAYEYLLNKNKENA